MGLNSTEVTYGFGQMGSTYLTGNGAILDLDGAAAKYYVVAIQITEDVTFQKLLMLDGGKDKGVPNTHFISTEDTGTLDTDWGAVTTLSDNDSVVLTTSHVFPKGVTLYGSWDHVELNSGAIICYVALRPDYITRSA